MTAGSALLVGGSGPTGSVSSPSRGSISSRAARADASPGGEAAGRALVSHPGVPVISFTGSTATGAKIGEECGRLHKRLSLEMGGKNAMIVMDDADLDLAVE